MAIDDWKLASEESDRNAGGIRAIDNSRRMRSGCSQNSNMGSTARSASGSSDRILIVLEQFIESSEDHYLMISGQLDALHLELDEHKIGPWADPHQYIVNRLVKPDHRLAADLDPPTQLRLLAWLYRLHDPRISRAAAGERAMKTLQAT